MHITEHQLEEVREKFEANGAAPRDTLTSLKKRYPGLTEEEYARLDAWYTGYAALIFRMYERITNDPTAYADFLTLTSRPSRPSMTGKVDSPKQTTNS